MKRKEVSLLRIISHISNIENAEYCYVRKDDAIVEMCTVDTFKYNIYKDYVQLPFVKREEVYMEFLDKYNLKKIKKELMESENFEVAFRRFFDGKWINGLNMCMRFNDFRIEFLKPLAQKWCEDYRVKYYDDTADANLNGWF